MFRTPLRVYPIQVHPECLDTEGEVYSDLFYSTDETVAWLNGQGASREGVMSGYEAFGCDFDDEDCPMIKTLPDLPVDEPFTIHTSDGGEVVEALASLTRRFQLIRDYVSDFPNERSIIVPYPREIVRVIVEIDPYEVFLSEVYECLCHLNPTSAVYYFYFDTEGTSPERLKEIASLCTDEEKSSIIDATRIGNRIILPSNGLGLNFIAGVLYLYADVDNAKALFSDYPSFITSIYATTLMDNTDRLLPYMMSVDYSKKLEFAIDEGDRDARYLMTRMFASIETREEAEYVLSVFKEGSKISTPYRWNLHRVWLREYTRGSLPLTIEKMVGLLKMDESIVRSQLGIS